MDWEHVITVCTMFGDGKRIPAIRITGEKGEPPQTRRLSYTCCFYNEVDHRLHTVLHLPERYLPEFAVLMAVVADLDFHCTGNIEKLTDMAMTAQLRVVPPDSVTVPHQGGLGPRKRFGATIGETASPPLQHKHFR